MNDYARSNERDCRFYAVAVVILVVIHLCGALFLCDSALAGQEREETSQTESGEWSTQRVHELIKDKNAGYGEEAVCVIEQGKLVALDLSKTKISNFTFLASMPTLGALDLRATSIRDLSVLRGLPLAVLGLEDTRVSDLAPLKGMKLEQLYLNNTKVEDLTPLSGMPLELLSLSGTAVEDLSPLSAMKTLRRLHIARSGVTVLTPIRALELERLVFTPRDIEKGLDIARNMKSIQEIGIELDSLLPPAMFWSLCDQGLYDK
jgi:hypothetical protein